MEPIIFALLSAVFFGFNIVLVKMGMNRNPNPWNAILTFSAAAFVLWLFVLFADRTMPSMAAALLFAVAGVMAPGVSSIINFESVRRAGVSITTSLVGTAPLFSTVLAIALLKEKINTEIAFGTLLIVSGIALLSWFRPKSHVKLSDLLLPLVAALFIGGASVISKFGLNISNVPFSGIAIAVTAGVASQLILTAFRGKLAHISHKFHDAKYFLASGIFAGFALASLFVALSKGNLTVVFPIANTQPLFAIFFSWLLLRKHDHIGAHTIIGALSIVAGASLVTFGAP